MLGRLVDGKAMTGNPMTGDQTIDYEALAQDAMRGVVRTILMRIAKTGLPGEHHFYISFDTLAAGTSISKRLKEKYPEEMTIVLQHRFWDLAVTEDRFEVKLTFDGIPERLVVPFTAIKVFFDPSVRYGLQFEAADFGPDAIAHPQSSNEDPIGSDRAGGHSSPTPLRAGGTRGVTERKPRAPRKTRSDKSSDEQVLDRPRPTVVPRKASDPPFVAKSDKPGVVEPSVSPADSAAPPAPAIPPPTTPGSAQIVSLDAFRKK